MGGKMKLSKSLAKKRSKAILSNIIANFLDEGWEWQFAEHLGKWGNGNCATDDSAEDAIILQDEIGFQAERLLRALNNVKKEGLK